MTRTIVLASRNAKKVEELQRILTASGLDVDLVGAEVFAGLPDIAETGTTFSENAHIKAIAVAGHTGLIAVADDSGLTVAALNGMPGVLSARWAGGHGDDAANLSLVLEQVRDTPDHNRGAAFVCAAVAARVLPDGSVETVSAAGTIDGRLRREPIGANGFGYDPIFEPEGHTITTAQMSAAEKDAISHRGRAFRALADHLATWL